VRVPTRLAALAALALAAAGAGVARPVTATAAPPVSQVTTIASTVPGNGDVNPYGVAVIKKTEGALQQGNVLVSNFNNSANLQGTGTTLVQVNPNGSVTQFAQIDPAHLPGPCPGGVGLTTALSVLPGGWVVVGSLPTADGTSATAQAGCLLVLDKHGTVRETLSGNGINGPWDMTSFSHGDHTDLFVTNVLNGTVAGGGAVVNQGTVLRITLCDRGEDEPPTWEGTTQIGSGFAQRTDPTALVIGPTGVGLSRDGALYVADSVNSAIDVIPDAVHRTTDAGTGTQITSGGKLNGPLGLAVVPEDQATGTRAVPAHPGDILTVNSGDGFLVETTPHGRQIAKVQLDNSGTPPGAGALFGIAVAPERGGVYFVDNASNTLGLLH
jgi:hypothetical protein